MTLNIVGANADRDRDQTGRPQSARARDALGRPLPPGARGVPRIPDDLHLAPADSLSYAQRLLDQGLAFNAHEVLEAAWKDGPDAERELWQGLAQLAVGITHVQRGNRTGAAALLHRSRERLAHTGTPAPHGIDAAGLADYAAALIDDLGTPAGIPASRLQPRLTL